MSLKPLLIVAAMSVGATATAQMSGMDMPASTKAASAPMSVTKGEALKVDSAAGKVTLRHGSIDNLGMPGMTMTFPVADKKLLAGIKDGDSVQFTAERVNGAVVVTTIEHAK